jgi:hypothetical protein
MSYCDFTKGLVKKFKFMQFVPLNLTHSTLLCSLLLVARMLHRATKCVLLNLTSINRRIKTSTRGGVDGQFIGACARRCCKAQLLAADSPGEREVVEGRLTKSSSGSGVAMFAGG